MNNLNKTILKVAQENPEFRKALVAELKTARGLHESQIHKALYADYQTGVNGKPDASTQAAMPKSLAQEEREIVKTLKALRTSQQNPGRKLHVLAEEISEFALHLGWLHSPPADG